MQHPIKTTVGHQLPADAVDQRQITAQAAGRWQAVLEKTGDKYARRYFEGQITLCNLRAAHQILLAQSSQGTRSPIPKDKSSSAARTPVIRAKSFLEISLAEKGRNKALAEGSAHRIKAAAFAMLADRWREMGMESRARTYEARASLESASARGFDSVIKAYDKKLEALDVHDVASKGTPDAQNGLDYLERAERNLEEYNRAHAEAMGHIRKARQVESEIHELEANQTKSPEHARLEEAIYQRDMVTALAEEEALRAARCYGSFEGEIESARKVYEVLGLAVTGQPLELTKTYPSKDGQEKTQTPEITHQPAGNSQRPAQTVLGRRLSETSIAQPVKSEPQGEQLDSKQTSSPNQPYRKVAVGVVVSQVLRELDRGM